MNLLNLLLKVVVGAAVAVVGYKAYQAMKPAPKDTPPKDTPPPHGSGYWLDGLTDGVLPSDAKYVDVHGRVWTYGSGGPGTMSHGTSEATGITTFSIAGLTLRSQIAARADASYLA